MSYKIKVISKTEAIKLINAGILEEVEEVSFPQGLFVRCIDENENSYFYEKEC